MAVSCNVYGCSDKAVSTIRYVSDIRGRVSCGDRDCDEYGMHEHTCWRCAQAIRRAPTPEYIL